MKFVTRQTIRAQLKGLVTEKKALNFMRMAHKAVLPEQKQSPQYQHWFDAVDCRRDQVRHQARHVLLAYAFLRGVPYRALEPRCRPDNEPIPQHIVNALFAHRVSDWKSGAEVQAWLEAPVQPDAECRAA